MVVAIVLVRHFVQWWVMEDEERGFHVVGGLLLIGTWWVFIVGLFYTIIRKKVPYIPTPKDENEGNNWPLNIPNLIILLASIVAIIYGLYTDWSPYTFVMAFLAGLNCLFMAFNIAASRQHAFRKYKEQFRLLRVSMSRLSEVKRKFWTMRRRIYTGLRSSALLLTVFMICLTGYLMKAKTEIQEYKMLPINKHDIFLSGIFAPQQSNGLTSIKLVKDYQSAYKTHFDIVSIYIPWGDEEKCNLPQKLIDSIYQNSSTPMITWEPWESLFQKSSGGDTLRNEKKVFSHITNAVFDDYLLKFSNQIKALKRPVFLRFAHEADNPFYPWSAKGNNTPEEFKNAWKYVHDFFSRNGAYNVIWVWNPWKATAINAYFPGEDYVDWVGVTCLNYASFSNDKKWYSMEQLYQPFHNNPVFRTGLPVMLAEMGSLQSEGGQADWFKGASQSVKTKFHEVKAFVLFNSGVDKNMPDGTYGKNLNWQMEHNTWVTSLNNTKQSKHIYKIPAFRDTMAAALPTKSFLTNNNRMFVETKGINYTRGQSWYKNYHPVTERDIVSDFTKMKQLGINTIKQYGPGIYDRNILVAASKIDMKVHYGFWIPDEISFISNNQKLSKLAKTILKTVNDLKDNNKIVAWNIGNNVLQQLSLYYYKHELFYKQESYMSWLRKLIQDIKIADPKRPVTVDVEVSSGLPDITNMLQSYIPEIDSYALILNEKSTGVDKISQLHVPYFFSKATVEEYLSLPSNTAGVFIADWQDPEINGLVSFDGLKDYQGRSKYSLFQIGNKWSGMKMPPALPKIKILKPAAGTFANVYLTYHALIYTHDQWELAENFQSGLQFEWYLIKTDNFGNGLLMKKIGTGPNITFAIPENPSNYKLYMIGVKGNVETTAQSKLNTPL